MKVRYAGLMVTLLLAILLAGCGGEGTPTVPPTPKEVAVTTTPDATVIPGALTLTPPPLATPPPRPSVGLSATLTLPGTPPPSLNLTPAPANPTSTVTTNQTPAIPSGPTPTSDARAVPIAQAAVKQMQAYKSYHFTAVTSDTAQTTTIGGDYVAPDRLSVQTSLGGQTVQQIVISSDVYLNSGTGWAKSAVDASTLLTLARLWNTVVAVNGVTLVGDEQLGEEPVTHLRAVADVADTASLPGGTAGTAGRLMVDSWVDKGSNAVRRISLTTSIAGQTAYTVDATYINFDEQVTVNAPTP